MEVSRALGDVWWERIIWREADLGEVGEDEVAAFGFGVLGLGLELEVGLCDFEVKDGGRA